MEPYESSDGLRFLSLILSHYKYLVPIYFLQIGKKASTQDEFCTLRH